MESLRAADDDPRDIRNAPVSAEHIRAAQNIPLQVRLLDSILRPHHAVAAVDQDSIRDYPGGPNKPVIPDSRLPERAGRGEPEEGDQERRGLLLLDSAVHPAGGRAAAVLLLGTLA